MRVNTTIERTDPGWAAAIRQGAGRALRRAGAPKKIAAAGGVGIRLAQDWCAGDPRNPVARCAELLASMEADGLSSFEVLAYLKGECAGAMMRKEDEDLIKRFWDLMGEETARQGALDQVQATFALTGDLEGIERLAEEHGTSLEELRFVARELRRRGLDPRTHTPMRRAS